MPGTVLDGVAERLPAAVREALLAPLVDHHCHGVRRDDLDRDAFEIAMTEAGTPAPPGATHFDTPLGLAIRRWCAPVLGLPPHAAPDDYLARRAELGAAEANRRLLTAAGVAAFLVDTGLDDAGLLSAAEMAAACGAQARKIVRLERVEQRVVAGGPDAAAYADRLADELAAATADAVGIKSIAAYRHGLDLDPARPSRREVVAAAGRRLADPGGRLADPVLLRHLLWAGVDAVRERGLPLQFHCGFGDTDVVLHRADPALLTGFIRAVAPCGVPVVLLHCYPYHRQAAYLAAVYPHVYADVGLALTHTAAGSPAVLGELLELAPFHKQMYSSDCYGLAEACHLGALYHRRGLAAALAARIEAGEWSAADAARIARMIGSENARRVYRL
ncbi:amidohydrolase family protein [Thermostaphylospora chromogena]|uniref:Amidohydrolase-related domain-containing protein n=1 Tax=Thermostaphylospora chromogena TaxID=35622 RepID=A0A1H1GXN3_9ACTN|nr:amidohydrolase family protein [Thermostaphylospora chromogena]SDR17863.1 hypothetical protein SAMN04489764_3892 [Thermostaphylospora chromogena]